MRSRGEDDKADKADPTLSANLCVRYEMAEAMDTYNTHFKGLDILRALSEYQEGS